MNLEGKIHDLATRHDIDLKISRIESEISFKQLETERWIITCCVVQFYLTLLLFIIFRK